MGLQKLSLDLQWPSGVLEAISFFFCSRVSQEGKTFSARMAEWHLVAKEAHLGVGDWGRFLWIQGSAGGGSSWPAVVKALWDLCLVAQLVPSLDWSMLLDLETLFLPPLLRGLYLLASGLATDLAWGASAFSWCARGGPCMGQGTVGSYNALWGCHKGW